MNDPTELLAAVGEMVYGADWRAPLARSLDVSERTVRRWAKGESPIPPTVWPEIRILARGHVHTINGLIEALEAMPDG